MATGMEESLRSRKCQECRSFLWVFQLRVSAIRPVGAIFLPFRQTNLGDVRMGLLNAAYMKLLEVIRALQAADEEFLEGDAGD